MAYAYVPHPYLRDPLLYVTGLLPHVTDNDLARALEHCVPFRPTIPRDTGAPTLSGTIEFKTMEKAEKALATLQARQMPCSPPAYLVLSPYPPSSDATLPPPQAQPRIVKQLPPDYSDAQVYDIFRPFGPLASVRMQQGTENAIVEFWNEEDAARAEEQMHCAEVGERNISVQLYQPRRGGAEFSPSAPPFVPSGHFHAGLSSPPRQQAPFMPGPGQQVQLAPPTGPGSTSHSGLIDPCNLFIKNLDADIDSNGLFSHFRHYGHIVSARVMRDDRGNSRGFGFVSYQTPDQAARAMAAMNNSHIGTKNIVVRLHEPKQLRQEKLAARYSGGPPGNGHPRSSSGATSPTLSDDGNFSSYNGWSSPGRQAPISLAEQTRKVSGGAPVGQERTRRSSGSYYHAALAGTLNLPMRYEELAALSTVVRREVISGELTRRLRDMRPPIPQADIEATVDSMANLPIQEVLDFFDSPTLLAARARGEDIEIEVPSAPSRGTSADSRGLVNNPATASAPEHPSTPASISTPPRTSSPSGSLSAAVTQRLSPPQNVAPAASERDRMAAAVGTLESDPTNAQLIVDLLLTLTKAERAKILFSRDVLRNKVEEARLVLDTVNATEDEPAPPPPVTPAKKKTSAVLDESPQTPALSSRGPSAVASPEAATPPPANVAKNLANLSAKEILARARSSGLPDPDPSIVRESDVFFDGLTSRDIHKQKQMVGEKLFKIVKAFDSRAAPKVTISLLDSEDLRALVHLMNEYPSVLREKVTIVAAQINQAKK
ncbi:hypothetical protein EXIGLDRAFT_724268 [Exidia glandulosa HHB12029]|uniref:Uncharacterized protein n=1 Tax=Exidia glandulosa HHB12029 TaxID=1314781 RepID=A0A165MT06_EXIGL|nr:hypothetical protein EXIGLDRAFT_724268 [Exidia glandulosa HHB12029]